MATIPTSNAIPSESPRDLAFNAGKIDEFVNSQDEAFSDRFNLARLTIAGIEAQSNQAITSIGFIPVDSFEAGATISSRNQSLHYVSDGNYYRWDGTLPKIVPSGSTPSSSGGVSIGSWVNVTDNTLRTQLASLATGNGSELISFKAIGAGSVNSNVKNKLNQMVITPFDFGAVGDGTTNDTPAFQAASNSLSAMGGTIRVPSGYKFLIDTSLTIRRGVSLVGDYRYIGIPGSNNSAPFGQMGAIIVNPSANILLESSAGISGFLIYRKGMTFPAVNSSLFSGTAIIALGDDCFATECLIIGFDTAYFSSEKARPRLFNLYIDNINGILIDKCLDVGRIDQCHAWPFATIEAVTNGASGASLIRSGTSYSFTNQFDAGYVSNCFSLGYKTGFSMANVNGVMLSKCQAEGVSVSGSVGFSTTGTSTNTVFSQCTTYGCDIQAYVSNGFDIHLPTTFVGCNFSGVPGVSSIGIEVDAAGDVNIGSSVIQGVNSAWYINNGNSVVNIASDVVYRNITTTPIGLSVQNNNIYDYASWLDGVNGAERSTGSLIGTPTLTTTATLALPTKGDLFNINPGVNITSGISGGYRGREITLIARGSVSITNGGGSGKNLVVGASTLIAGGIAVYVHDGIAWYKKL